MTQSLRDAAIRLKELKETTSDVALLSAIDAVVTAAVAEKMDRGDLAMQLAGRVSKRQEAELVKIYGPTSFNKDHIDCELIAEVIRGSDLL